MKQYGMKCNVNMYKKEFFFVCMFVRFYLEPTVENYSISTCNNKEQKYHHHQSATEFFFFVQQKIHNKNGSHSYLILIQTNNNAAPAIEARPKIIHHHEQQLASLRKQKKSLNGEKKIWAGKLKFVMKPLENFTIFSNENSIFFSSFPVTVAVSSLSTLVSILKIQPAASSHERKFLIHSQSLQFYTDTQHLKSLMNRGGVRWDSFPLTRNLK